MKLAYADNFLHKSFLTLALQRAYFNW